MACQEDISFIRESTSGLISRANTTGGLSSAFNIRETADVFIPETINEKERDAGSMIRTNAGS
jgi:hypothetical protein